METSNFAWILTNIHEEKSYILSDETLLGRKNYCDIKIWIKDFTENDIRFENKKKRHLCMKTLRTDLKQFQIKINRKPKHKNHIHLHNKNYMTIDSYLFRVNKVQMDKQTTEQKLLNEITKKVIEDYKNSKHKKIEKKTMRVLPNIPPLTGIYIDGKMTNSTIDLTQD